MPKKNCPGCAIDVDSDEEFCPFCQYEFPEERFSMKLVAWMMVILTILWFVF